MEAEQIAIYGAGGSAREVAWLVESYAPTHTALEVVCFIDDNEATHGNTLNGIPIMGLAEARVRFPSSKAVCGVGAPRTREMLVRRALAAGFDFGTLVHPRVERSRWVQIGAGTVICAGSILTTNITLGSHVQINVACTIGHDVVMGDYTTLAPGVHIAGAVHLGHCAYVGIGASIINGTPASPIVIGDDAVIGAGACVTKSVPAGVTVVGVPAKPLMRPSV